MSQSGFAVYSDVRLCGKAFLYRGSRSDGSTEKPGNTVGASGFWNRGDSHDQ
jgi:hypothetical protein